VSNRWAVAVAAHDSHFRHRWWTAGRRARPPAEFIGGLHKLRGPFTGRYCVARRWRRRVLVPTPAVSAAARNLADFSRRL